MSIEGNYIKIFGPAAATLGAGFNDIKKADAKVGDSTSLGTIIKVSPDFKVCVSRSSVACHACISARHSEEIGCEAPITI